jgi:formylglycine-generating enzyme required for sulfatase activity
MKGFLMTATKRKLLYAMVVLLFVLVIALIGRLAHVLFAFGGVSSPARAPVPVASVNYQQPGEGPLSEAVIDIDALPELPPGKHEHEDGLHGGAGASGAAAGHIPCICEGYGPQITAREAFSNPLTHETVVSAMRAVVALNMRTIEIQLAGGSGGGRVLTETPTIPASYFLAGARSGFDHDGAVSAFSLAGAFKQVYPGIDLAYYTDAHHIEYAFLLGTGADPSLIRLHLAGVRFETMSAEGNIVHTGDGFEVYQRAPVAFRIEADGRRRPVAANPVLRGEAAVSVAFSEADDERAEELNGMRFNLVPGESGEEGPDYDLYMSRFELSNTQWIRFLNDAELNVRNPRGDHVYIDKAGNAWMNPAMQPDRDELFLIRKARIRYNPDRAPGDRYTHIMDDHGRRPFADHPAVGISWYGAVKYCNWLTLQAGRGPDERCYREGTNLFDWAPVTSTNWTNGLFTAQERRAWLDLKGFRLPMLRLYDGDSPVPLNTFNELLKAGSWNGTTNVAFGFGIQDLAGNAGEWVNDPARGGVPDARSLVGGSFRDRARTLRDDVMAPPYFSDDASSFRPVTTYMPGSMTQVNVLFCFHAVDGLPDEWRDRFSIGQQGSGAVPPPRVVPSGPSAPGGGDELIPGVSPSEPVSPVAQPGIIYRDDDEPSPVDPPVPGGGGGGGGDGPFIPLPPQPPIPPPQPRLYILDVYSQNPDHGVDVALSAVDVHGRSDGTTAFNRQYEFGRMVTLTAPGAVGANVFQYWLRNGQPFATTSTLTVQMLSDLQLTAVYVTPVLPTQRTLVVDSSPDRNLPVVVSLADNNGLRNGNTLMSRLYENRTELTVSVPATFNGETFLGWLRNGGLFSLNPTVTVVLLADMRLTALYGQPPIAEQRRLVVASSNPDEGVPVGLSIPDVNGRQDGESTFDRLYEYGKTVTLTAPPTAPNGNTFVRWLRNGTVFSYSETVAVTMISDWVVTAEYASPPPDVLLTVGSVNPGSGVAIAIGTADNAGNSDGTTTFTRRYNPGTTTTVTAPATAPNGNLFNRWVLNGAPLSTNTTISLTLLADSELIAAYQRPTPPVAVWTLDVRSQNPASGVGIYVSAADTNGNSSGSTAFTRSYEDGTPVSLTAPANAPGGQLFSHWLVDGVRYSDSETISLMMTGNRTVTAVYVDPEPPVRYLLTVQSRNPNSAIVVTVSPADVNGQQNGATTFTRLYEAGEGVTLTARNPAFPGSSNVLRQWLLDGVPISTNATITVTMLRDTVVTAVYGPEIPAVDHTLRVESRNPDGGVPISISVSDLNGEGSGNTTFERLYSYGTNVTAVAPAVAPGGNRFEGWLLGGSLFTTNTAVTVAMLGDITLTALYATPPVARTLTVSSQNPASGVAVSVSQPDNNSNQNGATAFQRIYDDGETVTLAVPLIAPNGRDLFLHWLRDGIPVTTNNTVDVALYADVEMTAVYIQPPIFDLTVRSDNPDWNVLISIGTADVLGRTDGRTLFVRTYNPGETTTVTAPEVSPAGTVFQYWLRNGVMFSTNLTESVTMLADLELTAVYGPLAPVNRSLIVRSVNPDGGVLIQITPNDTRALGDGETSLLRIYPDGATVTVTAPATAGTNSFRQWILNGLPLTTNLTGNIIMSQDHELIAVYESPVRPEERVLTVDSRNPNSGVPVSVSTPDISGNTDGSTVFVRIYTYGQSTTLVAPETGGTNNTTFLRWERDGVPYSENRTVTIDMFSDVRMTAVYGEVVPNVTLTVESLNPDSGVVISVAPGDLNSETTGTTTFQRLYEMGQTVTLSAPTTVEDRPFLQWLFDGVPLSTNPVVNVTMLADRTMTAVYGDPLPPVDVTLIVRAEGPDGDITTLIGATPDNNANAGGSTTFTRVYDTGTLVTLTAPPVSNGLNFDHWEIGGSIYSNSLEVTLTLLANTTITAIYVQPAPSVSGL